MNLDHREPPTLIKASPTTATATPPVVDEDPVSRIPNPCVFDWDDLLLRHRHHRGGEEASSSPFHHQRIVDNQSQNSDDKAIPSPTRPLVSGRKRGVQFQEEAQPQQQKEGDHLIIPTIAITPHDIDDGGDNTNHHQAVAPHEGEEKTHELSPLNHSQSNDATTKDKKRSQYEFSPITLTFYDPALEDSYVHFQYVESGCIGGKLYSMMAVVLMVGLFIFFNGSDGPSEAQLRQHFWIVHYSAGIIFAIVLAIAMWIEPLHKYREYILMLIIATHWPAFQMMNMTVRSPHNYDYCYPTTCYFFCSFISQPRIKRIMVFLTMTPGITLFMVAFLTDYWQEHSYLEIVLWPLMFFPLTLLHVFERSSRRAFVRIRQAASTVESLEQRIKLTQSIIAHFFAPTPTYNLLCTKGHCVAKAYKNVGLVVTDIAGFTAWTSRTAPSTVINQLSKMFRDIDDVMDPHGMEKIATIGDAFIGATFGRRDPDGVVDVAVRVAAAARFSVIILQFAGDDLSIRVGLHCGTVLCGCFGTSPPKFDLLSEDYELAKSLEAEGCPGQVHISNRALEITARHGHPLEPELTPRGVFFCGWEESLDIPEEELDDLVNEDVDVTLATTDPYVKVLEANAMTVCELLCNLADESAIHGDDESHEPEREKTLEEQLDNSAFLRNKLMDLAGEDMLGASNSNSRNNNNNNNRSMENSFSLDADANNSSPDSPTNTRMIAMTNMKKKGTYAPQKKKQKKKKRPDDDDDNESEEEGDEVALQVSTTQNTKIRASSTTSTRTMAENLQIIEKAQVEADEHMLQTRQQQHPKSHSLNGSATDAPKSQEDAKSDEIQRESEQEHIEELLHFHPLLLQFDNAGVELRYILSVRRTNLTQSACWMFISMTLALFVAQLFLCCIDSDQNRLVSGAIALLITTHFAYLQVIGTDNRFNPIVIYVTYMAITVLASLALRSDCTAHPHQDRTTGYVVMLYYLLWSVIPQFLMSIPLKFRILIYLVTDALLCLLVFLRHHVIFQDDVLVWDWWLLLNPGAGIFVSYFADYTLRRVYQSQMRLRMILQSTKGKSAEVASRAADVMLPKFVSDRMLQESKKSKKGRGGDGDDESDDGGATESSSAITGATTNFMETGKRLLWEYPHVGVMFIQFYDTAVVSHRTSAMGEREEGTGQQEKIIIEHNASQQQEQTMPHQNNEDNDSASMPIPQQQTRAGLPNRNLSSPSHKVQSTESNEGPTTQDQEAGNNSETSTRKLTRQFLSINATILDIEHILYEHGVQKVKTIGSTIMAATGITSNHQGSKASDEDGHLASCVESALAIARHVFDAKGINTFRVGIHVGPLFGAVLGDKGLVFDLFGDTVNTASRVMSSAPNRSVRISSAVHARMQLARGLRFVLHPCDPVHAKGKGQLIVFSAAWPERNVL